VVAAMTAMARIFKQSFIGGILCNAEPEEAYLKFRVHESVFFTWQDPRRTRLPATDLH